MAAGFIRSPEAVLDVRAYQEALPHPAAAAGAANKAMKAAAQAAVKGAFMREIVPFRFDASAARNGIRQGCDLLGHLWKLPETLVQPVLFIGRKEHARTVSVCRQPALANEHGAGQASN